MTIDRDDALRTAKKLVRTFSSAPDARRQARAIYSALARAEGWTDLEEAEINALGAWLTELPPVSTLRARCEAVMVKLTR